MVLDEDIVRQLGGAAADHALHEAARNSCTCFIAVVTGHA